MWGLLDGRMGLELIAAACATIGIIIDNTIYFIYTFKKLENVYSDTRELVRKVFDETLMPMMTTNVILMVGFSILMLGDFVANARMGFMTMMTILAAIIADLLLLPALMLLLRSPSVSVGHTAKLAKPDLKLEG